MVLGLVLGDLYIRHENIWYPIIVHAAINTSSILITWAEVDWLFGAMAIASFLVLLVLNKITPDTKDVFWKVMKADNQNADKISAGDNN